MIMDRIFETLQAINSNYGYGSIQSVTWYGGRDLIVTIRRPFMFDKTRKASFDGSRIRFCGHVRKLKP